MRFIIILPIFFADSAASLRYAFEIEKNYHRQEKIFQYLQSRSLRVSKGVAQTVE